MRVITQRATMLAGDRSRDKAETKPRRDQSCEHFKRVSQLPELCALAHILFYVTSALIRVFMRRIQSEKVEIAVIIAHLT